MKFNNESEKLMELLLPLYKKHIKSYSLIKNLLQNQILLLKNYIVI